MDPLFSATTPLATLIGVTHLELQTPDGTVETYLTGSGPGVLFYIDAIGLRPQTEQMSDRMASWGYTVLTPNVLYRSGTAAETSPDGDLLAAGAREAFFEQVPPRLAELTPDRIASDARVYLGGPARTGRQLRRSGSSATAWARASPYGPPVSIPRWWPAPASTAGAWRPRRPTARTSVCRTRGPSSCSGTPTTTGGCSPTPWSGSAARSRPPA